MNTLQKIIFGIMDWITDGALTDRKILNDVLEKNSSLRARNSHARDQIENLRSTNIFLAKENANFERANRILIRENNRLTNALRMAGNYTECVDQFVSDKTKICDMQFRIDALESRLRKHEGPRKYPGGTTTGQQMGL